MNGSTRSKIQDNLQFMSSTHSLSAREDDVIFLNRKKGRLKTIFIQQTQRNNHTSIICANMQQCILGCFSMQKHKIWPYIIDSWKAHCAFWKIPSPTLMTENLAKDIFVSNKKVGGLLHHRCCYHEKIVTFDRIQILQLRMSQYSDTYIHNVTLCQSIF